MIKPSVLKYSWSMKILLPLAVFFVALLVLEVLWAVVESAFGNTENAVGYGIFSVAQNVVALMLPAIASAYFFTRKPFETMRCDVRPSWKAIALALGMYVVSLPMMNWVEAWNANLTLPESMSALEHVLRSAENDAQKITGLMINGNSLLGMIGMVMVIGVLTGIGEEFFFRGAMLGSLVDHSNRRHAAVWLVAAVFSFMHFQFFGFVPRLLMGVWLGYLFVWSGSVWVPVIYHAFNNSMVVVVTYLGEQQLINADEINGLGVDTPWLAAVSLCVAVLWAVMTHRHFNS